MTPIISLKVQVRQLSGLLGTADLNDWEDGFVSSVYAQSSQGKNTTILSEKQIDTIEKLYKKHFG